MTARNLLVAPLVLLAVAMGRDAVGQTTVINETFDTYNSSADLYNVWSPFPEGSVVNGALYTDGPFDAAHADANPDGGNALEHIAGPVLQNVTSLAGLKPTASQNVRLSFDIYDSKSSGNKRVSVGLRQESGTANLFEMGFYNSAPGPFYMFRFIGFPGVTFPPELTANAGWYAFNNLVDDAGAPITPPTAGANASVKGWHTMAVEFGATSATLTLDLNRDGNINATTVVNYTAFHTDLSGGFDRIRIGGPSGVASTGGGALFDNVLLETIAVTPPVGNNADFNGDNIVDGKDFLIWQRGFGAAGTLATGDANNDTLVNDADLTIFKTQFGTDPTPAVGAVAAIPEPTTLALAGLAVLGTLASARRRK